MKLANRILLPFLFLIISCEQQPDQKGGKILNEKEEQAIYKEIELFLEAWNQGDAKAAASFYTEDGVRVGAGERRTRHLSSTG